MENKIFIFHSLEKDMGNHFKSNPFCEPNEFILNVEILTSFEIYDTSLTKVIIFFNMKFYSFDIR